MSLRIIVCTFVFALLSGCTSNPGTFNLDLANLNYPLPAHSKICLPEVKYQCSSNGCERTKPTVFILYDEINSIVYRCDDKPCDAYEMEEFPGGAFKYLVPKDGGNLTFKMADGAALPGIANQYVETAGILLDVMVSHGTCYDN